MTKIAAPNSREPVACGHCGAEVKQPLSGRPKQFCDTAHRKAANRSSKSKRVKPQGGNDDAFVRLAIWMASHQGLLEVSHPEHGLGVLWVTDTTRLRYKNSDVGTELIPPDLEILAWHDFRLGQRPLRLKWVHPEPRDRDKPKKIVQLFDSDRNRDLSANAAKWDGDGGRAPDAEVAVLQARNITRIANNKGQADPDSDRTRWRDMGKFYADRLADLMMKSKRRK